MKKIVILSILYFVTRLFFLQSLPIFNDEAISLHRALLFIEDIHNWKIPLIIAGKQPGYPVLLSITQFFSFDSLIMGRLLSIVAGYISFIGVVHVYKNILQKKNESLLALLLISSPIIIFFDRLSLVETTMATLYTISFILMCNISKKPEYRTSITLGVAVALGWWLKLTMLVSIPTIILSYLYISYTNKNLRQKHLVSFGLTATAFLALISPLYFHPIYKETSSIVSQKTFSIQEILSFPIGKWLANSNKLVQWLVAYLSPLVFGVFVAGLISIRKRSKELVLLLIWLIIPYGLGVLAGDGLTTRYIYIVLPLTILAAGLGLEYISKKFSFVHYLVVGSSAILGLWLILHPLSYYSQYLRYLPEAHKDFGQYVTSWPSGFGVRNASEWLKEEIGDNQAFVFVRFDWGNPEDAMYILLKNQENIQVLPLTFIENVLSDTQSADIQKYFVSRGPQTAGLDNIMTELIRFDKPISDEFIGIYRIQK